MQETQILVWTRKKTAVPKSTNTQFSSLPFLHCDDSGLWILHTLLVQDGTGKSIKQPISLPLEATGQIFTFQLQLDLPKPLGLKGLDPPVSLNHKTQSGELTRPCGLQFQ